MARQLMDSAQFTHALLTLLSLAFLGWAGVVWRATQTVSDLLKTLVVKVDTLAEHVLRLEHEMDAHAALDGHPSAIRMHAIELEQLSVLRRDLDEIRTRNVR